MINPKKKWIILCECFEVYNVLLSHCAGKLHMQIHPSDKSSSDTATNYHEFNPFSIKYFHSYFGLLFINGIYKKIQVGFRLLNPCYDPDCGKNNIRFQFINFIWCWSSFLIIFCIYNPGSDPKDNTAKITSSSRWIVPKL